MTTASTRKVCVVITARPSYSRIQSALRAIAAHPHLELQLVLAASALLDRYGELTQTVADDGFQVAARVYMIVEGENVTTMAKTTGLGMVELATVFDNLRPHIVVTIADRFETLATAAAAAYMNIPIAHIQGGEVTGSIDEKVRHAVTKLSNLHFVSTALAAERVTRMGEMAEKVFVTGCPSIDLAAEACDGDVGAFDPFQKYGGVGEIFDPSGPYLVVMQHPVTTEYDLAKQHVSETLTAVHSLQMPAFWFWPNVDAGSDGTSKGIRMFRESHQPRHIHFFKNMAPRDFLRLLNGCATIVGNSSVGIRECSFLGVPAVNIGTRQHGRERGPNVMDVGYDRQQIRQGVEHHLKNGRFPRTSLYGDGKAGPRIADLLARVDLDISKSLAY